MADKVTINLPREVAEIVFKVLEFDLDNVDFDDDGEYDAALGLALEELDRGLA